MPEKLLDDDFVLEGHGIVADTAFPVSNDLLGRIITPLKEGDLERAHPQAQQQLHLLSTAITPLRQACEWGVGSIERKLDDNCFFLYLLTLFSNIFRI